MLKFLLYKWLDSKRYLQCWRPINFIIVKSSAICSCLNTMKGFSPTSDAIIESFPDVLLISLSTLSRADSQQTNWHRLSTDCSFFWENFFFSQSIDFTIWKKRKKKILRKRHYAFKKAPMMRQQLSTEAWNGFKNSTQSDSSCRRGKVLKLRRRNYGHKIIRLCFSRRLMFQGGETKAAALYITKDFESGCWIPRDLFRLV